MIIAMYIIMKDDYEVILKNLSSANTLFILIAFVLVCVYYGLKTICMYLIAREYKKNIKFVKILEQTLITQFFNGITPFSTGGQPGQVYMLKNSGLSVASATSITIQDFLMYQVALVVMGILSLLFNGIFNIINISSGLFNLIILGFIINISVGLLLVFISFSKKFNDFAGKLIIKLLSKMRIVKDKKKTAEKWEEKLDEFNNSAKLFKDNKMLLLKCFLFNLLALTVYYSISFFIFKSINADTSAITILSSIVISSFILLVGNFIPLPGGSGGIEGAFLALFGMFSKSGIVKTALILWRSVTYYFGVLIGGITLSFYKGDKK